MNNKEKAIELLEKAKVNTQHIDDCCHDQNELMEIRQSISEPIDQVLATLKAEPKAGEFTEEKAIELMSKAFTEYRQAYRPSEGENGVELLYPRNKYSNIIAYMVSKIWPLIDSQQAELDTNNFWKEIVVKDNELDVEQIKKELHDFYFIMKQVPRVYMAVTGDKLSKVMYSAETVIAEFEDYLSREIEKAVAEEKTELQAEKGK